MRRHLVEPTTLITRCNFVMQHDGPAKNGINLSAKTNTIMTDSMTLCHTESITVEFCIPLTLAVLSSRLRKVCKKNKKQQQPHSNIYIQSWDGVIDGRKTYQPMPRKVGQLQYFHLKLPSAEYHGFDHGQAMSRTERRTKQGRISLTSLSR